MKSETPKNIERLPADGQPPVSAGGKEGKPADDKDRQRPDWTNGLRQLYDSVVEEPLPDTFQDLLDQLDSKN